MYSLPLLTAQIIFKCISVDLDSTSLPTRSSCALPRSPSPLYSSKPRGLDTKGGAMVCLSSLCDPPLEAQYRELLSGSDGIRRYSQSHGFDIIECELPLIDLRGLGSGDERERRACVKEIAKASSEWGFFQVLNHGISSELLEEMKTEQMKAFKTPFDKKSSSGLWNGSYRWGNPSATSLDQFYWSEAFHFPLVKILEGGCDGEFDSFSVYPLNQKDVTTFPLSSSVLDLLQWIISEQGIQ